MNPFVLNTVIKDCWNATGNYYSATVRPTRVSKAAGSAQTTKIATWFVDPPKVNMVGAVFHYYQLGDIDPSVFGIDNFIKNQWISAETLMQDNEILINVGLDNGILLSPKDCWFKKAGADRNWILAVFINPMFDYGWMNSYLMQDGKRAYLTNEDTTKLALYNYERSRATLDETQLLIHFYRNPAYFKGVGRAKNSKVVSVKTHNPATAQQALNFLNQFTDDVFTGWVLFNGMISTLAYAKANAASLAQREVAVYVDKTISKKMWIRLSTSTTHRLGYGAGFTIRLGDTGFYNLDDVSIFLGSGTGPTFKGVALDFDLKQYTYQISDLEIGIDALAIGLLKRRYAAFDDYNNLYLYVVVRKNVDKSFGLNRTRLDLLTGLSLGQRNLILIGEQPELNYWSVDALRVHPFLKLMRSPVEKITDEMVIKGYGYSGVNRLFNPYPILPKQISKEGILYQNFTAGVALRGKSSVGLLTYQIEALVYDNTGRLLRSQFFSKDESTNISFSDLPNAKFAELSLTNGYKAELRYFRKLSGDLTLTAAAKAFGYACYVTTDINSGVWSLARPNLHYDIIDEPNNVRKIKWRTSYLTQEGLVGRSVFGGDHYHYMTTMGAIRQQRSYGVMTLAKDLDGRLGISPATIDIYLAEKLLIEGIDYLIVKDKIYIHAMNTSYDSVRVRLCGLSPTGNRLAPIDVGFTDQGRIGLGSKNRQVNYKQCQFNIGGLLYLRSEVKLGNSGQSDTVIGSGVPYAIKQRVASLEHYLQTSSIEAMLEEDTIDDGLYNALQAKFPISSNRVVTAVTEDRKRRVISCFLNEVLYQMRQGRQKEFIAAGGFTVASVAAWVQPYLYLQAVDICFQPSFNSNFMLVVAHHRLGSELTQRQFEFLQFVNTTFLNGIVKLDGYFTIR